MYNLPLHKLWLLIKTCYLVPLPIKQDLRSDTLHLVLAIVLLRMTQNSITQAADVSEGSVALVRQLLQAQHGPVSTVCEWSLQQLEDLNTGIRL